MVRFDYACKKCEKTFVVWSDEAKRCAYCGSKRVFKVFITPPAMSTGTAERVDKLAEQQLEAAGLSNYTNRGGEAKRTFKTDPKRFEAMAAAKANNVPFDLKGPIRTGPILGGQLPTPAAAPVMAQTIGSRGKGKITFDPKGSGALVNNIVSRARQVNPLSARTIYRQHPKAKEDMNLVQRMIKN